MGRSADNLHSPEALFTADRLRKLVAGLPEVDEVVDKHGHTSFKVRKKTFVMLGDNEGDGPGMCVKSDKATQAKLLQTGRYRKTPYIGQHGWVSPVEMPPGDWEEMARLVEAGYRLAAPKTLVRRLDAGED